MTVSVRNLVKRFKSGRSVTDAVQNVSFDCAPGTIFGLLGLNGAGKTSILRIVCTVLGADAGSVFIMGFDVRSMKIEVRKRIGFLPADAGLYENLTPREILTYYARLYKYPEEELNERVDKVIAMVGIQEFADKRTKGFSSGMKQKVCLARSVVHDPPVMIFDEPTNSLDVVTRRSVHNFMRQCRNEGKCVILSTHIMSEAEKLCDDLVILHKGRVLADGSLNQIRTEYGLTDLEDIFIECLQRSDNT